jgi:predicted dehydrogenase
MTINTSRRGFLRGVGGVALLGASGCCTWCKRSGKIRLAAVGIMGKGFTDWLPMVRSGLAEIVAFCDADANQRNKVLTNKRIKELGLVDTLAKVPFYTDYRRMLDDQRKLGIEAMTVSTPDHMHAAIAIRAMKMGIHCYVQKPLVRTLWEAKYFGDTAKEYGVITQMGNQGSGTAGMRRGVEVLRSGVLGDVKEVHVWTNRPVWPQGFVAEKATIGPAKDVIPEGLDWNAWIGTAKMRTYRGAYPAGTPTFNPWNPKKMIAPNVYHSFNWRGFIDFGAGAFGDMACHTMNLPFRGLELAGIKSAECTMIEEKNDVAFPTKSIVKLQFKARESKYRKASLPEVTLYWYDGNHLPSADLMPDGKVPKTGCIIIGTKGTLCSTNDYGGASTIAMKGETVMQDINVHPATKDIEQSIPRCNEGSAGVKSMGGAGVAAADNDGHYVEFLNAINGNGPVYADTGSRCFADVDFSIPMMEGILCGVVAQQVPGVLNWCSCSQRFDNAQANALVKPFIRDGFEF